VLERRRTRPYSFDRTAEAGVRPAHGRQITGDQGSAAPARDLMRDPVPRAKPHRHDDMIRQACGLPYLFIPLRNRRCSPGPESTYQNGSNPPRLLGARMFVFSADDWSTIEGGHIRARMFAPGLGIGEDPATGSACAALAGFLALRSRLVMVRPLDRGPGRRMGRPSRLELEVDLKRGQLAAIKSAGHRC
jgi:PhzF family phenazine biosynthesis protein